MSITNFRGKYNFLSNFYQAYFDFDGNTWDTSEAAYQACKTDDWDEKIKMMNMGPVVVKKYGRKVPMFDGFEEHKDEFMRVIVACKFHDNPALLKKLIETGDEKLVEGNTWHDNYWGICRCGRSSCGVGKNKLGKVLMQIRDFAVNRPETLEYLANIGKNGSYKDIILKQ